MRGVRRGDAVVEQVDHGNVFRIDNLTVYRFYFLPVRLRYHVCYRGLPVNQGVILCRHGAAGHRAAAHAGSRYPHGVLPGHRRRQVDLLHIICPVRGVCPEKMVAVVKPAVGRLDRQVQVIDQRMPAARLRRRVGPGQGGFKRVPGVVHPEGIGCAFPRHHPAPGVYRVKSAVFQRQHRPGQVEHTETALRKPARGRARAVDQRGLDQGGGGAGKIHMYFQILLQQERRAAGNGGGHAGALQACVPREARQVTLHQAGASGNHRRGRGQQFRFNPPVSGRPAGRKLRAGSGAPRAGHQGRTWQHGSAGNQSVLAVGLGGKRAGSRPAVAGAEYHQ